MINSAAIHAWIMGHAATVVGASAVLGFEPKAKIDYAAAGNPTVAAVWFSSVEAVSLRPGLAATAARIEVVIRLHRNALGDATQMQATERALMTDADAVLALLFGDIRESATDVWFDPRGQTGEPVKAPTGYLALDNQLNRVCTITAGVVVDNAWAEVE